MPSNTNEQNHLEYNAKEGVNSALYPNVVHSGGYFGMGNTVVHDSRAGDSGFDSDGPEVRLDIQTLPSPVLSESCCVSASDLDKLSNDAGKIPKYHYCPHCHAVISNPFNTAAKTVEEDAVSQVELSREDYYCIRCVRFCFRKPKLKYWYFVTGLCTANPKTLPILRILFAVYIFACYIVFMSTTGVHTKLIPETGQTFFFLTTLGFVALWLYFVLSGWYSWTYARDPKAFIEKKSESPMIHMCIQILYSLNVPIHFLIVFVYWSLIAQYHFKKETFTSLDHWLNISSHGATLIMLIIEISLNQMRFYFCHIVAFFIASLIYCAWTIIGSSIYSKPNEPWYVYPFFDLKEATVGYWYMALLAGSLLGYLFVILLHYLKYRYIRSRSRHLLVEEAVRSSASTTLKMHISHVEHSSLEDADNQKCSRYLKDEESQSLGVSKYPAAISVPN